LFWMALLTRVAAVRAAVIHRQLRWWWPEAVHVPCVTQCWVFHSAPMGGLPAWTPATRAYQARQPASGHHQPPVLSLIMTGLNSGWENYFTFLQATCSALALLACAWEWRLVIARCRLQFRVGGRSLRVEVGASSFLLCACVSSGQAIRAFWVEQISAVCAQGIT